MLLSVLFIFQFDGVNGDRLIRVGSEFTKNQKFTIEELKEQRRKDQKLDDFLTGEPQMTLISSLFIGKNTCIYGAPRAKVIQSPLVIVQFSLLREHKNESWQQRVAV